MFRFLLFWRKRDYNKDLTSAMGVFYKAQRKAQSLMSKIEAEVDSNAGKISALQERNFQLEGVHSEIRAFAANLSKLVK